MKHHKMLEAAETQLPGADHYVHPDCAPACGQTDALVNGEISRRERRSTCLPASLFADPAWDMLLELYRAQLRHYRVTVTSLSVASKVPSTTALRWICALETEGLISRHPDPLDRRRVFMQLTSFGATAMTDYFSILRLDTEQSQQCARL